MALANYGVLKCKALDRKIDPASDTSPHYQILASDGDNRHRIAINVKSQESPSELLYLVDDNFQHSITDQLLKFELGFHKLDHQPGGAALDFIRSNLFKSTDMKPLPPDVPGPGNDLKELIDLYVQRSLQTEDAVMYAFGVAWGPEANRSDQYFGFLPGRGIHDIHMNQGSVGTFQGDNGVYQDGALLIHFPSRNQWVGIFLAFQSQCFHTNDTTGNAIRELCEQAPVEPSIKILAALVNPLGADPGKEAVMLMNVSPNAVDLNGWAIADKQKRKSYLRNVQVEGGDIFIVRLTGNDAQLSNDGGIITLLDAQGTKVHGVSYTKDDVSKQGWWLPVP